MVRWSWFIAVFMAAVVILPVGCRKKKKHTGGGGGGSQGTGVTYYVSTVGDDTNTGLSPSEAFRTIAHALSVAQDGDTIIVADGTYYEHDLDFQGKKIHLKSANGPTNCIIDCQQQGRAFHFHSGETADSILEGFTIQNGKVSNDGGAILCENNSSPTISNCTFSGNNAVCGGAICCYQSSLTIQNCAFSSNSARNGAGGAVSCGFLSNGTITNCTFSGNSADDYGGAIECWDNSSLTITNCTFSGNSANDWGGAIFCDTSTLTAINCVFSGNSVDAGGAILCMESSLTMTNCTFTNNSGNYCGGAIHCEDSSSATLNNCILWGNSAGSGGDEIYIYDSGSSCTLNHCCVDNKGYGGYTGNITENNCIHQDPLFVNPASGDLHLQSNSPCIDAGNNSYVPSGVTEDLDGNPRIVNGTVDIGAYEKQ